MPAGGSRRVRVGQARRTGAVPRATAEDSDAGQASRRAEATVGPRGESAGARGVGGRCRPCEHREQLSASLQSAAAQESAAKDEKGVEERDAAYDKLLQSIDVMDLERLAADITAKGDSAAVRGSALTDRLIAAALA